MLALTLLWRCRRDAYPTSDESLKVHTRDKRARTSGRPPHSGTDSLFAKHLKLRYPTYFLRLKSVYDSLSHSSIPVMSDPTSSPVSPGDGLPQAMIDDFQHSEFLRYLYHRMTPAHNYRKRSRCWLSHILRLASRWRTNSSANLTRNRHFFLRESNVIRSFSASALLGYSLQSRSLWRMLSLPSYY